MGRYRKLLVAFDGSPSSINALKQAIKLSETEKSWIKILAVVPSYDGDLELIGVNNIKAIIDGPTEKLLDKAKELAEAARVPVLTNVEHGEAYEKIVDVANTENCDLIIMGRRGTHNIERMLMGSVTSRVIGYTRKDVLVVPKDSEIGWENILLAIDDSNCSEVAARHAINFAKSYGGSLTVISVVDVTDEFYAQAPQAAEQMIEKAKNALKKIRGDAEASGVTVETIVKEGDTYGKIVEMAKEKNADMIFMGSHGRTGIKRLLMGSATERVIGHADCAVLVVKK